MPDNSHESSFMMAAQAQLDRLDELVDSLVKASGHHRRYMVAQGVIVVILVVVIGVMAFLLVGQHNSDVHQKQSLVQACENSNQARRANQTVFDALIDLSISANNGVLKDPFFVAWENKVNAMPPGPDKAQAVALLNLEREIVTPKSGATQQVENFKDYIARSYQPVNCSKIIGG